jgi:hypothetical protein
MKFYKKIFILKNQINEQLNNDLQNEQKQINSYRIEIETLTNDIHEFEKNFEELKQEKNQLLINKMDGDQDDERQNLVRQLTQEKVEKSSFFLFNFSFIIFFSRINMNNKQKNFEKK